MKKLPPDDELITKKENLNLGITTALNSPRKTIKITIRDKLHLFNNELLRFKNSGISYKIIRRILAEQLELFVSEQTLREHCQQELGFKKRKERKAVNNKIKTSNSGTAGDVKEQASTEKLESVKKENPTYISENITYQTQSLINQLEDY